jgi:hypothetical protein
MSDEFGTVQEAMMHVRRADSRWQAAVHSFDSYPDRLRRLAEAADGERKALLFAELCNVKWKPQPGARGLRLAIGLDPGNRIGPEKLWAKFDKALDQLGVALEGDGFGALAAVFASLSATALEIADALENDDEISRTG